MAKPWPVVDLFSGAGGMSCGFSRHPGFSLIGAADAQVGKPSSAAGLLGCNATYAASPRIRPIVADLATADPADVCTAMALAGWRPAVPAARQPLVARDLTDLWQGWRVEAKATHVRRAIWDLPPVLAGEPSAADPLHVAPVVPA